MFLDNMYKPNSKYLLYCKKYTIQYRNLTVNMFLFDNDLEEAHCQYQISPIQESDFYTDMKLITFQTFTNIKVCNKSNMTGTTSGAGTAYTSGVSEYISDFW